MNEKREFKLPGSGYDTITKILHAYVLCGDGSIPLGDVAGKSGLDPTLVSRNNGFLLALGAIQGGRDKELTQNGRELAIAIGNNIEEDIIAGWQKLLLNCPETKSILEMVRVQKGVVKDQFQNRMASTLGMVADKSNATGFNTLIDILEISKLLIENGDGKYQSNLESVTTSSAQAQKPAENQGHHIASHQTPALRTNTDNAAHPSVHIDLQIHISPESTPEQIEKIFESIAKHLYNKS